MKKKNTKLKVLGVAAAMVMVMGATAVTTWAFTRTSYESNFKATFVGSRNVEATIEGASYLSSQAEAIETLKKVTFSKSSTTSTETASFTNAVAVINAGDYAYYDFKITNKSENKTYSDLIVEPIVTNTNTSVVTSLYYSVDGEVYQALTEDYLAIHKQDDLTLRVIANPVDGAEDIEFTGGIKLNLNTENDKPANYTQSYKYSIDGDVAYKTPVCTTCTECTKAAEAIKMSADEYIIVTPTTAQDVLNNNIDNKVILFNGNFTENLLIKATAETATIYEAISETEVSEKVASVEELNTSSDVLYHYYRDIKNVTFAGVEGTIFTSQLSIVSETMSFDNVRNISAENYQHVNVDGLTIQDLAFSGKDGRLLASYLTSDSYIKNVVVENCTFNTSESNNWSAAIRFNAHHVANENIIVKNNDVNGHYQGVYIQNVNGCQILGNTITNSKHNGIAVQSSSANYNTGDIIIKNNTVDTTGVGLETGERAIRFGYGQNANIVVENNTFANCAEDRTADNEGVQLLKSQTLTGCTYTFANNTYDSADMADVYKGSGTTFVVYIEEPTAE